MPTAAVCTLFIAGKDIFVAAATIHPTEGCDDDSDDSENDNFEQGFSCDEGEINTCSSGDPACPSDPCLCLAPVSQCPRDPSSLAECRGDLAVGMMCEGSGECGTSSSLGNCDGTWDVYVVKEMGNYDNHCVSDAWAIVESTDPKIGCDPDR